MEGVSKCELLKRAWVRACVPACVGPYVCVVEEEEEEEEERLFDQMFLVRRPTMKAYVGSLSCRSHGYI